MAGFLCRSQKEVDWVGAVGLDEDTRYGSARDHRHFHKITVLTQRSADSAVSRGNLGCCYCPELLLLLLLLLQLPLPSV